MNKIQFLTKRNLNGSNVINKTKEITFDISQNIKDNIYSIPNTTHYINEKLHFINDELNKERTITIDFHNILQNNLFYFKPCLTEEEEIALEKDPDFKDIKTIDYWIGKAKSHPDIWKKATLFLALGLQVIEIATPTFAATTGVSTVSSLLMRNTLGLDGICSEILQIFSEIAKYCFLALGFKDAIVKILNGGTVKEAIQASLQYAFGYMFLMLYPTLFNKFSKIRF